MPDIDKTSKVIDIIKNMSSQQIAVTIFLAVSCVSIAFWVENRYAKLADTTTNIEQQQTEIILLQTQILNVVNSLPPEIRKEVVERSITMQSLRNNKPPQH